MIDKLQLYFFYNVLFELEYIYEKEKWQKINLIW